jgi:hypothetical protein
MFGLDPHVFGLEVVEVETKGVFGLKPWAARPNNYRWTIVWLRY